MSIQVNTVLVFKIKNIIKFLIVSAVFTVLLFGIFGFGLGMDMNSQTAICPFDGHLESICEMNPMEHAQEWQSMFTTLSIKDTLALLSLFIALFAILKLRQMFSVSKISQTDSYINLFYIGRPPIFNPFKEAFSNGILNPKIF